MNLEKWTTLQEKTALLSVRERAIIAGTCVVLVLVIWMQVVYSPIEKMQKKSQVKRAELNQNMVTQSDRLNELTSILALDPNASLRQQQEKLNKQLLELRSEIEGRLSHLIAPEKMADIMHELHSDYKGLSLVSARNLPVKPLKLNSEKQNTTDKDTHRSDIAQGNEKTDPKAVIFMHGYEITLSGNYFQTLEFLQRLETMDGFFWQSLSYKVETYPKAQIILQLSTLSLEEDWIGV